MSQKPKNQLRKFILDLGPLVLFFVTFEWFGIYTATGVFMAAVLTALGIGYALERKISPMPVVTAILVMVFGGLTLYLHNDIFIKMKPTMLYLFFAVVLIGGLFFNRLLIKYAFGEAFSLTENGWRGLTWRWGIFFAALAILNEIVWRNFSTDTWVAFKVWGMLPLTFIFAIGLTPFLTKHRVEDGPSP